MANIYGENYVKEYSNVPSERGNVGENGGKVKVLFDKVAAGAGLDVLHIGKIPAGARILSVDNVGGNTPSFNVAKGDLLAVETSIQVTLGAAPTFPVSAWVTYAKD